MSRPRARGFTLIEMVVASTLALLVYTAATQALLALDIYRRTTTARTTLLRDGQLAMDWLRRDIYAAGNSGATGTRLFGSYGNAVGANSSLLIPPIMTIEANRTSPTAASLVSDRFVIFGDVPRPDTNFDQLSSVQHQAATDKVAPLNELSGYDGTALGALVPGAACAAASDPGCPWSLRKYVSNAGYNEVTLVHPNGTYENVQVSGFTVGPPALLNLTTNVNTSPSTPFPAGRVTQVDRIAYAIDATSGTLQRRQCWGRPEPDQSNFANFGTPSASATPTGCSTANNDTGWQVVARNVDTAASLFRYCSNAGACNVTIPANVRSVEVTLALKRNVRVGKKGGAEQVRPVSVLLVERMIFRSVTP
ncbi:MAG: prepilin-type N-terminal cleavage/methylation domain-containing protein [Myxococcota bacterium]